MNKKIQNILVIKHGALGDIIKAMGAFATIRQNHIGDKITILTTQPFQDICEKTKYFDDFILDPRTRNPFKYFDIIKLINKKQFDMVYDLQCSNRTNRYFKILNMLRPMKWSGTARRCTFLLQPNYRKKNHPYKFYAQQLKISGLNLNGQDMLLPKLSWLKTNFKIPLPNKFVLIIPGCSKQHPEKRWPINFYGEISKRLHSCNIKSVIVGTKEEDSLAKFMQRDCSSVINLIGKTSVADIFGIAKKSLFIIGNDTGPTFLASTTGKTTIIPWSSYVKPSLHAPIGKNIICIEEANLYNLNPDYIWLHAKNILRI